MCVSAANKCLLKVAQYAAQMEQYEKAIDIYEQVNKLLYKFSSNHFSGWRRAFSLSSMCVRYVYMN